MLVEGMMSAGIINAWGRFKNLDVKNEILCPLVKKKKGKAIPVTGNGGP
jgi:hypothetical protein